eukprot:6180658-Pleurochrysis_carterae.AAC.1
MALSDRNRVSAQNAVVKAGAGDVGARLCARRSPRVHTPASLPAMLNSARRCLCRSKRCFGAEVTDRNSVRHISMRPARYGRDSQFAVRHSQMVQKSAEQDSASG